MELQMHFGSCKIEGPPQVQMAQFLFLPPTSALPLPYLTFLSEREEGAASNEDDNNNDDEERGETARKLRKFSALLWDARCNMRRKGKRLCRSTGLG